jgi:hypothetical protein
LRRLRELVSDAGHPRSDGIATKKDVDGRVEPGHDEKWII